MRNYPKSTVRDPYGLTDSAANPRRTVLFGDVDASAAVIDGRVHTAMREMPSAEIWIDVHSPLAADIDFTTQVVVAQGDISKGRMFTGHVMTAEVAGDLLRVSCSVSPAMNEPIAAEFAAKTAALDTIYTLLRETGMPDERMELHGLDELPLEIFEVMAPVDGLVVTDRVTVADTVFLPEGAVASIVKLLDPHTIIDDFLSRRAYAVTYVTAALAFNAEKEGLRRIDSAVAWSNVSLRFSNAVRPGGRIVGWTRLQLRQLAIRGDLVAVRGLSTGRSSVRRAGSRAPADLTMATGGGPAAAAALGTPGIRLREATAAAARAISSPDPSSRVSAISECLEFYTGSTKVPYGFTRTDHRQLLSAAKGLGPEKAKRVEQMLSQLNQAPLMARLRVQLAQDGVPMTEGDVDTLKRVRAQRNDLVHGRHDLVDEVDLERAVALLARILTYASAELANRQAQ